MGEILFYHLTESKLEDTLPDLILRSLQRKWRVSVLCRNNLSAHKIDSLLWTFSDNSFIPHGLESEQYPEEQPVLLTLKDLNINNANVCFCLEGLMTKIPEQYDRVCLMFDNENDEYIAQVRATWKKLKAEQDNNQNDFKLTYWQQTPQRKWIKKA